VIGVPATVATVPLLKCAGLIEADDPDAEVAVELVLDPPLAPPCPEEDAPEPAAGVLAGAAEPAALLEEPEDPPQPASRTPTATTSTTRQTRERINTPPSPETQTIPHIF